LFPVCLFLFPFHFLLPRSLPPPPPPWKLGHVLPSAGALAVGARARVPDGFVSHFDGLRGFLRESEKIPVGWAGFVVVGWCRDGRPKIQSVLRELPQIWRRLFCAGGLAGWGRVAGAVWRVAGPPGGLAHSVSFVLFAQ
jgi:hypothetical protein